MCRFPASSFRAEARNLFRLRSGKQCEERDHEKHRTPNDLEARCFMQMYVHRKKKTVNEKDPSAVLGMTKREQGCFPFFSSRLGSQPPPLRGTSFHGKEGVCRFPASSFRAEARNLFRLRSGKQCEERDHEKHRTPNDLEARCFMQMYVHRKKKTVNEKDPSAVLGMTKREQGCFPFFSSRLGSQPPPLRGTSFHGKEGVCRFSVSSSISCVSHPLAAPSSSESVRGVSSPLLRRR